MKKRKDIRSMMMLMILITIPTCGKLSYSRILSMATLSLSRLHIIRTVQLKTKDMRTPKTQTIIRTVQMKTTSKEELKSQRNCQRYANTKNMDGRHNLVESPIIMM